jgi:hypothetical protein
MAMIQLLRHSFNILSNQQYGKKGEKENKQDSKVHVQLEPLKIQINLLNKAKQLKDCMVSVVNESYSVVENVAIKTNASLTKIFILTSVGLLLIEM